MSTYDAARIHKPTWLSLSQLSQGRGARPVHVVGWDTEASRGQPIAMQFSAGGGWADAELFEVPAEPNAALKLFTTWIDQHCRRRSVEYLVFGFNLQYEWTQLFGDLPPDIIVQNEFTVVSESAAGRQWRLDVMNYRRYNMTMVSRESHVRVHVLDGHAFYPGSLSAVARMVGVEDKEKMDKEFIGHLTRASLSDPEFRRYAMQDAVTTRLIGERIVAMHEQFDVRTCISAPHLASRVFRRRFLGATIPLPHPALEQAGLWSYHGGKNGYYHRQPLQTPAWSVDIVSAYPEAMRALPALEDSHWERTNEHRGGEHALWQTRLGYRRCRYGGAFGHDGRRLARGDATVWLTGYELDSLLAHGEATQLDVLDGYVLHGSGGEGSGLVRYVDHFFAEKRTTTGPARATAKLMLNSLYGKFFQKVPVGDVQTLEASLPPVMGRDGRASRERLRVWEVQTVPEQDYDYRAGGLYHPPVASLITGFVRAKAHDLEHTLQAHATSTDGMFTVRSPQPSLVGEGLGQLTVEHGSLRIWRERVYRFGEMPNGPVTKVALHGFRAGSDELQQIPLEPGSYSYKASHAVTLRESQRMLGGARYRPGEFALLDFTLDLTGKTP